MKIGCRHGMRNEGWDFAGPICRRRSSSPGRTPSACSATALPTRSRKCWRPGTSPRHRAVRPGDLIYVSSCPAQAQGRANPGEPRMALVMGPGRAQPGARRRLGAPGPRLRPGERCGGLPPSRPSLRRCRAAGASQARPRPPAWRQEQEARHELGPGREPRRAVMSARDPGSELPEGRVTSRGAAERSTVVSATMRAAGVRQTQVRRSKPTRGVKGIITVLNGILARSMRASESVSRIRRPGRAPAAGDDRGRRGTGRVSLGGPGRHGAGGSTGRSPGGGRWRRNRQVGKARPGK